MFRVCGIALALAGVSFCSHARADEAEDKAVTFVVKLRGEVTRDEKAPGKPVVSVRLRDTEVTDASLKELASLQHLAKLDLSRTKVTDAGLKELAALQHLATLDLSSTKVTGAGLKNLSGLKKLSDLNLSFTIVTDAELKRH